MFAASDVHFSRVKELPDVKVHINASAEAGSKVLKKGSGTSYEARAVIYRRFTGHLWGQREVTVGERFDHRERSQFQPVRRKNGCLMDASDDGEIGRKDRSRQSIILNVQWIICNLLKGMNNYASSYHQT